MLNVTVENIGDLAVVECEGRLVQSEAAFKLRQAVTSQSNARIVVLELSEVHAIEGGGSRNARVSTTMGSRPQYSIHAVRPVTVCP